MIDATAAGDPVDPAAIGTANVAFQGHYARMSSMTGWADRLALAESHTCSTARGRDGSSLPVISEH